MRFHHPFIMLSCAAFLLGALAPSADAQQRPPKPRQKMQKPAALISRQAPPKVNQSLAAQVNAENSTVVISLSQQRAYMKIRGTDLVYIDTPVSTGKRVGSTPVGEYKVLQKNADHRSSIYGDFVDSKGRVVRSGISLKVDSAPAGTRYRGAPMKYFCRLTWTGIGMHVGVLPGYPASHGCIRLPDNIAPLIYEKVKLGTPVSVVP
jgi:lipoprotein-anchoring transpeptidase ErfK/SrfK